MMDIDSALAPKKSKFWRLRNNARLAPQPWQWPLARLGDRDPIVVRESSGTRRGVDLGYAARPSDSEFYVPVYAAQSGEVSAAIDLPTGYVISLDHGDHKVCTHYAHLSKMFVAPCLPKARRRQFVRAGEVIGYAAKSPLHIRFELWRWTDGHGYVAVEPMPEMLGWAKQLTPAETRALKKEAA
jgi:murein DD-endopeptidase MepM/ murein hydrolase activator NlpD